MEHLDPDEDEEEGEASANARNKAITSLLGGPSHKNQNHHHHHHTAPIESDDEETDDEKTPGVSTLKRLGPHSQSLRVGALI